MKAIAPAATNLPNVANKKDNKVKTSPRFNDDTPAAMDLPNIAEKEDKKVRTSPNLSAV